MITLRYKYLNEDLTMTYSQINQNKDISRELKHHLSLCKVKRLNI